MSKKDEIIENRVAQDSSHEDDEIRTIDEDEDRTINDNPDEPSSSNRAFKEDEEDLIVESNEDSEDCVSRKDDGDCTNNLIHVKDAPRVEDMSDSEGSIKVDPEPDEGRDLEVDILEPITSVEEPEYNGLPSRTRHSSRRRRETRQEVRDTEEQPGPSQEGDVEMRPITGTFSRSRSSRRSLRDTLRAHSRRSVKRGPGESLNIMERRTLRREELNQMEQFEIKSLPFCTWLGYKISLSVSRSWQKFTESLKDFRIWGGHIREVEGNLGSGVSTYFRVLRWLLMINTLNLIVALSFITAPGLVIYYNHPEAQTVNVEYNADDKNCTNPDFFNETDTDYAEYGNILFQFLTGTGWMEKRPLYIGWYRSLNITSNNIKYRDSGCNITDDTYRCDTFKNALIENSDEREYDDKRFTNFEQLLNNFECDIQCPSTTQERSCNITCYKCGNYDCSEVNRNTAYYNLSGDAGMFDCYSPLGSEDTWGFADCQFPLINETNELGLKCSGCKREGVIYNFALAYVLVGLSYFVLSLLFIIKNMMKLFKKSAAEIVGYNPYSELVFGGWDYNIANKESAILKSKSILKSLKEELTCDDQKEKFVSTKEKVLLFLLRVFTNVLCIGAMGGVFYLYYEVYEKKEDSNPCSKEEESALTKLNYNEIIQSYGPALIVSASNVIFPIFFEVVGNVEMYQFQSTRINVTMARSFLMKLFSVVAYLYILYDTINSTQNDEDDPGKKVGWKYNCWENFIGSELYRLIIIDFAVFVVALLTTEWLRRLMVDHNRFIREKMGITEFNITKEVLDICYKQMIFWAALFFSPLVSVVAFIEIILMFYFKKISALRNVRPPEKVILNSSSSTIINIVFIISLLVVFVPIGFIIFTFKPSDKCGPFQNYDSFIEPVNAIIDKSGAFKDIILDNLKMTSVVVVIVVVTIIIIYFFYSLSSARQLTIQLLREQIKSENADKKFLIEQMKNVRNPNSSSSVIEDKIPDKRKEKKKKTSSNVGSYANPNLKNKI
ncbi:hypothetical protein ACHWQZ_G019553 [Mnemiopsis leidyi]